MKRRTFFWLCAALLIVALVPLQMCDLLFIPRSDEWVVGTFLSAFTFGIMPCFMAYYYAYQKGTSMPIIMLNIVVAALWYVTMGGQIGWIIWTAVETLYLTLLLSRVNWSEIKAKEDAWDAKVEKYENQQRRIQATPEWQAENRQRKERELESLDRALQYPI